MTAHRFRFSSYQTALTTTSFYQTNRRTAQRGVPGMRSCSKPTQTSPGPGFDVENEFFGLRVDLPPVTN